MGSAAQRRWAAAAAPAMLLLFSIALFSGRTAAADDGSMTDLQKHVSFFDGNGDGIVTISETYEGFRKLGLGVAVSSASAAFINGALGNKTRPANATSSHLDIFIVNIHKAIHGSDTGSYDAQGRFVPEKFDEIFSKHAKNVSDALTSDEIDEMLKANRQPGDYQGWVAAEGEWKLLYKIAKDKDGFLRKNVARSVYDGTLFHQIANARGSGSN